MDVMRRSALYTLTLILSFTVTTVRACGTSMTDGPYTADCHSRGYDSVPDIVPTDINALDFRNNSLRVLMDRQFQRFVNLHRLDLSLNNIQLIEKEAFSGIDHLITLELGGNRLSSMPYYVFHHLSNLVTLNLNNNPLKSLQDSAFTYLSKLEVLSLENCQLDYIAPKAFVGLNKLNDLNIAKNELRYLDSEIETSLSHSLKYFRLHGNPWQCDCHNYWLKRWLKMSEIRWYYSNEVPFCTGPLRLARKHWPKVDIGEFACKPIIVASQTIVEASIGGEAMMSCQIHADPKGEVRWYKDTTIVEYESLYTVHNAIGNDNNFTATLRIRNVTVNDTGPYYCEISNHAGQAEAKIQLVLIADNDQPLWLNFWVFVGIAVAAALTLILCGVLCFCCGTSRKRKSEDLAETKLKMRQQEGHYVKKDTIDDELGPICTVKIRQPLYMESMYKGSTYMDDDMDKRSYLTPDDWQRSLGYRNRTCGASPTSSDRTTTEWFTRINSEPPGYQEYRRSPALAGAAIIGAMKLDSPLNSPSSSFRPDRPSSYSYTELPCEFTNLDHREVVYPVRPLQYVKYEQRNSHDDGYNIRGTVV